MIPQINFELEWNFVSSFHIHLQGELHRHEEYELKSCAVILTDFRFSNLFPINSFYILLTFKQYISYNFKNH